MNYLIQVSICLITLYLLYFSLLRKDKFFQLQRAFLVGAIAVSVVIPLIEFNPQVTQKVILLENLAVPAVELTAKSNLAEKAWGLSEYMLGIYLLGVLLMSIRLGKNLYRILIIIRKGSKEKVNGYVLVRTSEEIPFASFHKYIFIEKSLDLEQEDLSYLLLHEQKHIQDKHSLDILIVAIVKVFFWFNPVLWLYEKDLKSVHEFICDHEVIRHTSKNAYEKLLIKSLFERVGLPLTSSFNDISIKNRIIMMNKQKSRWTNQLKVLVSLPVLFLLLLACNPEGLPSTTPVEVSGVVTNAEGKGLPGVNVVVDGAQRGTITNLAGEYKIGSLTEDQSLTYSFVGFNAVTVPVGTRSTIDVELEEGELLASSMEKPSNAIQMEVKYEIDINDGEKFSGKLMDADGNPLDGYAVTALGEGKGAVSVKTDENGNFELATSQVTDRFVVFDGENNVQVVRIEKE